MKGAPLPPIGRSNTALVLHDMQNDFIKASLSKPAMQVVVKRTKSAHRSCALPADSGYLHSGGKRSSHELSRLNARPTCADRDSPICVKGTDGRGGD